MIVNKKIIWCLFGNLAITSASIAGLLNVNSKKISSTKRAPIERFIPNAYGKMLFRNYQQVDPNESNKTTSYTQARYTLGSKFFNNTVDSRFVFGVNTQENSDVLKNRGTRFQTFVNLYENDYYNVSPFVEVQFPRDSGDGYRTLVGLTNNVSYTSNFSFGDVTIGSSWDFIAYYGSEPTQVEVTSNGKVVDEAAYNKLPSKVKTKFSLTDSKKVVVSQSSPCLTNDLTFYSVYKPSFSSKLSLWTYNYYSTKHVPKMTYNEKSQKITTNSSGAFNFPEYSTKNAWSYEVGGKYKIGEEWYVSLVGAFDEKENGKRPYTVMTTVGFDLF